MKSNLIFYAMCLLTTTYASVAYAGRFIVTNTNDAGAGSLRQAMTDVESISGADTIVFNIPKSDPGYNSITGVWTIEPLSDMPTLLNNGTVIDGTTQSVNQGNTNPKGPEIEINGENLPQNGFEVNGSDKIIKGLVINRCPLYGILINGSRNIISGNYIGTDATGTFALPNDYGIAIRNGGDHNIIGGSHAEERNVISGNISRGIFLVDYGTDSNQIKGNYIGTNASGDDTLCNIHGGIFLNSLSGFTIVGGTSEGERNIISGSIYVEGTSIHSANGITIRRSNNNHIIGNYIGTDKNAKYVLYNGRYGILIQECENNIIGGTATGESNIISGYKSGGVTIRMGNTRNNVISGNFIGTDPESLIHCDECSYGIYFDFGAHDNIIGPGNTIINNTECGIFSYLDSTVQNTFTQNLITHNGEQGICNGKGANDTIAAPVIQNVTYEAVTGIACTGCIVEIFSDSMDEGAIYEGSVIANEGGNFTWEGNVSGPFVTATATDTAGNTSEFSEAFTAPAISAIQINEMSEIISVYPNAANDFITINPDDLLTAIELYDIQGKLVLSQRIYGNNQVSIAHLNSGMYLYRIKSKKIFFGKLVIRNE